MPFSKECKILESNEIMKKAYLEGKTIYFKNGTTLKASTSLLIGDF